MLGSIIVNSMSSTSVLSLPCGIDQKSKRTHSMASLACRCKNHLVPGVVPGVAIGEADLALLEPVGVVTPEFLHPGGVFPAKLRSLAARTNQKEQRLPFW